MPSFYPFEDTHECDHCGKEFEYDDSSVNEWEEENYDGGWYYYRQARCPHCGETNNV